MFEQWADYLKDMPEYLEMPLEPELYKKAELAALTMGLRLEDAVMVFLKKLADSDTALNDAVSSAIASCKTDGRKSAEGAD